MKILSAKPVKKNIISKLQQEITKLPNSPALRIIQVGNNIESSTYIKHKIKLAKKIGIDASVISFPDSVEEKTLIEKIKELNKASDVSGIIVQLPLPPEINSNNVLNSIDYRKDVDGLTPINIGKLVSGEAHLIPATPLGILFLLDYYNIPTEGKHVVVLGRSLLVGRPISILLSSHKYNATVTLLHSRSKDIKHFTKQADILIVAIGKPLFINKDYVKKDSIIIDVGINYFHNKIVGDVDYDNVKDVVSAITPVPGGVGPMTVTALMYNVLRAYKIQKGYETVDK